MVYSYNYVPDPYTIGSFDFWGVGHFYKIKASSTLDVADAE
jgi:hypothetical protein